MTLHDLYAAVRAHHHRTIREQRSPYDRGKAEGRFIGVALAMDEIRQEKQAMTDMGTPADWVSEGERRALREWQRTHRDPCDECEWVEVQAMCEREPRLELDRACPKHGGRP